MCCFVGLEIKDFFILRFAYFLFLSKKRTMINIKFSKILHICLTFGNNMFKIKVKESQISSKSNRRKNGKEY